MPYLIGVSLAIMVAIFARLVGLDRDRAFYPTIMIVIALYYALFTVMGGHAGELPLEWIQVGAFILVAILGFKFSLWLVVAALVGHGVMDFFHARLITNPGVPAWWPEFCLAYDVTAGVILAGLLLRARPVGASH